MHGAGMPPPQLPPQHRPEYLRPPPVQDRQQQAGSAYFPVDIGSVGSDDIIAALSKLQGLMPAVPAAPAAPASNQDVDFNDIFNMMLKKE